jgi:hypothetical protein
MVTNKSIIYVFVAFLISIIVGMIWAVLLLGDPLFVQASPAAKIRYVTTTGNDSGNGCANSAAPCRTVQHAVDRSNLNDEIRVATGIYTGVYARGGMTQVVYISKTVTIRGGYNSAFTTWNPDTNPTTLDAQGQGRVVSIIGINANATLDGFIITGGDATGVKTSCPTYGGPSDGCGGGILIHMAGPVIANNVVTGNLSGFSTGPNYTSGGGICLFYGVGSVITGNLIINNIASTGNRGMGGGIDLVYGFGVMLANNQILSNTATTHDSLAGWGGGIAVFGSGSNPTILGNKIQGNRTNSGNGGYGAGIYNWYSWGHYQGNEIVGNYGPDAVYLGGYENARFEANLVSDNDTATGVYLVNGVLSGPSLVNNVIARSGNKTLAFNTYNAAPMTVTLLHNTLIGEDSGYGVNVETGYVTLYMTNTIIVNHTWGISNKVPVSSTVSADHILFWENTYAGITGTNSVFGDPDFIGSGVLKYHLGPGSQAIDAGAVTSEYADIDGDPRPVGSAPDIGADEARLWRITLPLVLRN